MARKTTIITLSVDLETLSLHNKAVEEKRGLTSELYKSALERYFGSTKVTYEQAKLRLDEIAEKKKAHEMEEQAILSVINTFEEQKNEEAIKQEEERQKREEKQSKQIQADYQKKIQTNLKYLLERFNISKEDAEVEAESYVIYKGTPQGQADKKGFNEYFEARGYELKAKKKPVIIKAISKEVHHNDL